MPSKSSKWFKFYFQDFLGDTKCVQAEDAALGFWLKLLCHMAQSSVPGWLYKEDGRTPMDSDNIKRLTGRYHAKKVTGDLKYLEMIGLVQQDDNGAWGSPALLRGSPYLVEMRARLHEDATEMPWRCHGDAKDIRPHLGRKRNPVSNHRIHKNKGKSRKDGVSSQGSSRKNKKDILETKTKTKSKELSKGGRGRRGIQTDIFKPLSKKSNAVLKALEGCSWIRIDDLCVIEAWVESFPKLDLPKEIMNCNSWAASKGIKRTPKGWRMTLHNWFKNNRHGGYGGQKKKEAGFAQVPKRGKDPFKAKGF